MQHRVTKIHHNILVSCGSPMKVFEREVIAECAYVWGDQDMLDRKDALRLRKAKQSWDESGRT